MMYSRDQIETMRICKNGVKWIWFRDPKKDDVMHYLMDNNIVCARCDIKDGYYFLTQQGTAVLEHIEDAEKQRQERDRAEKEKHNSDVIQTEQNVAKKLKHDFHVAAFSAVTNGIVSNIHVFIKFCYKIIRSICG